MKNKKGFTLIELLAVIVIVAILLAIAVPKVTQYITSARKNGMVDTAKNLVQAISHESFNETIDLPLGTDDITIVATELIKLEEGRNKSSFSGKWLSNYSYVAIVNVGTDIDPDYEYFIALRDSKRYSIPLTRTDKISKDSIVRINNTNNEVSITSMCGNRDGEYKMLSHIAGLEEYEPEYGWNATVYSNIACK